MHRFSDYKTVETIIYKTINTINRILPKVVGYNRARALKMKDYQIFAFMSESGVEIPNL